MAMKTVYLGAYTPEELYEMDNPDCFEFEGKSYEFKVEIYFKHGFLRIYDSCGRTIPIDVTHYADFARVLELAMALNDLAKYQDNLKSLLYGGKSAIGLESDAKVD